MDFKSLMSSIPGMAGIMHKFSVKYMLESFSKRIIDHVQHPVDKYQLRILFKTGKLEFIIYHPGPVIPIQYKNPNNRMINGKERDIPNDARLYDMDVKDKLDTIVTFVESQIPGFEGEIDMVVMEVDRDAKETPAKIFYQHNGEKKILNHILK